MAIIKPPILQSGDTVGIVTLGSPLDAAVIDSRATTLRNMGFNVVFGRYVYSRSGIVAASAKQRAEDLMMMFENKQVKMILPSRGGTGVIDILPYLDPRIIRQNPKIITGYSDVTILLNAINQFTGLETFHGFLLIDFKPDTPAYNYNEFFTATSSLTAPRVINNPPGISLMSLVSGNVTGQLVGGNLTSIVGALGTPYEIDTRGKIFLLEDVHAPTNTVYRYLQQLMLAGKFRDCIGIIMGQCTDCPISYNTSYNDLINSLLVPLGKPLMTNLATAHNYYKITLPIGAEVNLNTVNNTLTVLRPSVVA